MLAVLSARALTMMVRSWVRSPFVSIPQMGEGVLAVITIRRVASVLFSTSLGAMLGEELLSGIFRSWSLGIGDEV